MRRNGSRVKRAPERQGGFTLLELIIALTVLGVIVTIVFGALRVGVRAWEKGEREIESRQRERIVLDRIAQQMASIYRPVDLPPAEAAPYLLRGDAASVEFISPIALMPENRAGMVFVRYEVRTDREGNTSLWLYEENLARRSEDPGENEIREEDFRLLLPEAAECGFAYLRVEDPETPGLDRRAASGGRRDALDARSFGGKEYLWETAWDPEVEKRNPRAVSMTLRAAADSPPVRILAPIPGEDRS